MSLAGDKTACDVLGVEGVLADQVDLAFVEDPLDYVAFDLASALTAVDADDGEAVETPPLLATLVAEIKLYQSLQSSVDEAELVRRTLQNLRE